MKNFYATLKMTTDKENKEDAVNTASPSYILLPVPPPTCRHQGCRFSSSARGKM